MQILVTDRMITYCELIQNIIRQIIPTPFWQPLQCYDVFYLEPYDPN